MVRDYSPHVESSIAYCEVASEVGFGAGRDGACAVLGGSSSISRHDVREYYISKNLVLTTQAASDVDVPRFANQTSDLESELPSSSTLPPSATARILDSDLSRFQIQWCLESAINNDVVHNFSQGLYSVTYISSKFALPKSRVVEVVGLGLTQAAKDFTLPQWETVSSFCFEVISYSNAQCAFLVRHFLFCFEMCSDSINVYRCVRGVFAAQLFERSKGSDRRSRESGKQPVRRPYICCLLGQFDS